MKDNLKMDKQIVISKYNEDVSWINKINNDTKIIVYRKDGISDNINNADTFLLDNVGREIHSYIYHIYHNYNNLSDYTMFAQGHPFDHFENIIDMINGNVSDWNAHASLMYQGYWGFHYNSIGTMWNMNESKQFNGRSLNCQRNGIPHHNPLEFKMDLDKICNEIFENCTPIEYEFVPGAHCIITKEVIQCRPKSFYKNLLSMIEHDYYAPWAFERLMAYIFNDNFKIKQYNDNITN